MGLLFKALIGFGPALRAVIESRALSLGSRKRLVVVSTTFSGVARLDALASVALVNPAP